MLARLCLAGAQTADRACRYVYIFGLTIVRAVGMTRRPVGTTSVSKVQNYAFFLLKPNYHRFFSRHRGDKVVAVWDGAGGGAVCPPIVEIISGWPLVSGINCAITAKFSAIGAKFSAMAFK